MVSVTTKNLFDIFLMIIPEFIWDLFIALKGLSPHTSRLLTCALMACVFPFAQSLSIPPTPSTIIVRDNNDTDAITTTLLPINKDNGVSDIVLNGDGNQAQG